MTSATIRPPDRTQAQAVLHQLCFLHDVVKEWRLLGKSMGLQLVQGRMKVSTCWVEAAC
jgi:hypothetical protein